MFALACIFIAIVLSFVAWQVTGSRVAMGACLILCFLSCGIADV